MAKTDNAEEIYKNNYNDTITSLLKFKFIKPKFKTMFSYDKLDFDDRKEIRNFCYTVDKLQSIINKIFNHRNEVQEEKKHRQIKDNEVALIENNKKLTYSSSDLNKLLLEQTMFPITIINLILEYGYNVEYGLCHRFNSSGEMNTINIMSFDNTYYNFGYNYLNIYNKNSESAITKLTIPNINKVKYYSLHIPDVISFYDIDSGYSKFELTNMLMIKTITHDVITPQKYSIKLNIVGNHFCIDSINGIVYIFWHSGMEYYLQNFNLSDFSLSEKKIIICEKLNCDLLTYNNNKLYFIDYHPNLTIVEYDLKSNNITNRFNILNETFISQINKYKIKGDDMQISEMPRIFNCIEKIALLYVMFDGQIMIIKYDMKSRCIVKKSILRDGKNLFESLIDITDKVTCCVYNVDIKKYQIIEFNEIVV